jgi:hypothetical protein
MQVMEVMPVLDLIMAKRKAYSKLSRTALLLKRSGTLHQLKTTFSAPNTLKDLECIRSTKNHSKSITISRQLRVTGDLVKRGITTTIMDHQIISLNQHQKLQIMVNSLRHLPNVCKNREIRSNSISTITNRDSSLV